MDFSVDALEAAVALALVHVTDGEGASLGTGFVVDDDLVLTCHHVVGEDRSLRLVFVDGSSLEMGAGAFEKFPELDLALFRLPSPRRGGMALSLEAETPRIFWTKGYHVSFAARGLTSALPVTGEIAGRGTVKYTVNDRSYEPPVLILTRADVGGGLSGGPLVDPRTGAAFGVVIAHVDAGGQTTGFALALSEAASRSPALCETLRAAAERRPSFGTGLNVRGATLLCRSQVESALAELIEQSLYLPGQFCGRSMMDGACARLAETEADVLPIVGYAGVGKTNALAAMAEKESQKRPVLLLRGLSISEKSEEIRDLVDESLRNAGSDRATDADTLARVLGRSTPALWILLDGLNEARASMQFLAEAFIPKSTSWLKRNHARLIVTCRAEYWESLVEGFRGARLLLSSKGQEADGHEPTLSLGASSQGEPFRLATFSEHEAQQAAERYGLTQYDEVGLLRHPLMMRFAWELTNQGEPGRASPAALEPGAIIDAWINHCCRRVSRAAAHRTQAQRVRALLSDVARRMGAALDLQLSSLGAAEERELLDRLVDEHMFVLTSNGYRFSFDEVAEFLQAEHVPASELCDAGELGRRSEKTVLWNSTVQAFARLLAGGDAVAIEPAMNALYEAIAGERVRIYRLPPLFRRIVAVPGAERWVLRLLEAATAVDRSTTHLILVNADIRWTLSIEGRLSIVRSLAPGERDYIWRTKMWMDADRRRPDSLALVEPYSLSRWVARCLKEDALKTLQILATWIGDKTPLAAESHSEATVGDFALACMFYGRTGHVRLLMDLAALNWTTDLRLLARTLVEVEPVEVLAVLEGWKGQSERQTVVAELATMLREFDGSVELRRVALLQHLAAHAPTTSSRFRAACRLGQLSAQRERYWPVARELFRAGEGLSAYAVHQLEPFFATHATELIEVLHARIASDPSTFEQNASVLATLATDASSFRRVCEMQLLALTPDTLHRAGRFLEDALYRYDLPREAGACGPALELARRLLEAPEEHGLTPLLYATFLPKDRPSTEAFRDLVIDFAARTGRHLGAVITSAAVVYEARPDDALSWVRRASAREPAERVESIVVTAMMQNDAFAERIEATWRASLSELGPAARAFLRARDQGESIIDAACSVLLAEKARG